VRVGVVPFAVGAAFADLERSWIEAEKAGFDAVWTIDHATPTPDLRPSWEASSLLVAMAARTRAIPIGVLAFDVGLRHPFTLAGAVAVAQALSGGRVRVGLGAGDAFTKVDHDALALPFPPFAERVRRLEACCRALPRLWRGETVTDPSLGLEQAALGPTGIDPPPIIVAGGSRRVMEVAAREAHGWNLFTDEPGVFAARVEVLRAIEAVSDRREPLATSVYLFVERVARDLHQLLTEFEAAGAEEAMLVVRDPSAESIVDLAHHVR
jgi:alkanesulfonate monooxygenase SsuD/methylene tetrahydromethanopterin reductase-like flavin-dependent oxidoreductase (luciferase family)